jgi:hypothetical protein
MEVEVDGMSERIKKRARKEEENSVEGKVIHILTSAKLSSLKAMLEKDHAIECIFLLMLAKGRWKDAKAFIKQLKLVLPDGTFRARMIEIEDNGLAIHGNLDVNKRYWMINEFGKRVGKVLLDLFGNIADGGGD